MKWCHLAQVNAWSPSDMLTCLWGDEHACIQTMIHRCMCLSIDEPFWFNVSLQHILVLLLLLLIHCRYLLFLSRFFLYILFFNSILFLVMAITIVVCFHNCMKCNISKSRILVIGQMYPRNILMFQGMNPKP